MELKYIQLQLDLKDKEQFISKDQFVSDVTAIIDQAIEAEYGYGVHLRSRQSLVMIKVFASIIFDLIQIIQKKEE